MSACFFKHESDNEPEEDDDTSNYPSSTGSSVLKGLQRTTDTSEPPEPDAGDPVKKIRADTDSTKLRQFIGNLGND